MPIAVFVTSIVLSVGGAYLESNYGPPSNTAGPLGLSSYYAVTPTLLIVMCFWVLMHGFKVGTARTKYMKLAKKDDEKDVDERYALPNLYAQGTSKHVRCFNCVQRSHQQIMEAIHTAILSAMMGAVHYPITTGALTLLHFVGRVCLSNAYAASDGDASKRYSCPLAKYNWYGLLGNIVIGLLSCGNMVMGKNII